MMNNFISVIILNYNGKKFLKDCLDTITNQSVSNYEIILVDNNSTDDSVEFIKANYPNVRIIECKENYGFAKGNNIGVKNAKGRYIILLNNDTRVKYNYIETLYKAINQKSNYGLIGTTTCDGERGYSDKSTLSIVGYGVSGIFKLDTETFGGPGYSLIFDRDKIPMPFDDDYFLYYEDNYLAWLNRLKGYDAMQVLGSPVWHYGSGTAGKRSKLIVFHGEKNRIMNLLIFYSKSTLIKLLPLIALSAVLVPIRAMLVYGRREWYLTTYIRSHLWIFKNLRSIIRERKMIQAQRKINDQEILKYMTYKLSSGRIGVIINPITNLYCKLVRIKTYDT